MIQCKFTEFKSETDVGTHVCDARVPEVPVPGSVLFVHLDTTPGDLSETPQRWFVIGFRWEVYPDQEAWLTVAVSKNQPVMRGPAAAPGVAVSEAQLIRGLRDRGVGTLR
jgi:hypothetical protein